MKLMPGQSIQGRWNRRSYRIIRPLGAGAIGTVYLVQEGDRKYALKISPDAQGIALEYRVLHSLQRQMPHTTSEKVHGRRLGPFVSEMDDVSLENRGLAFFYTMEYVEGTPVELFVRGKGITSVRRIAVQLLEFLKQLHVLGYAFGDLKADNVLINSGSGHLRLIDFGGLTRFGEGVRQYTEWNDRGYWHNGTRRADCRYDLFAAAMLLAQLLNPYVKRLDWKNRDLEQIKKILSSKKETRIWLPVLEKAWAGGFDSAEQMQSAVLSLQLPKGEKNKTEKIQTIRRTIDRELSRDWDWTHWTVIGMMGICLTVMLHVLMVQ
jgi:serine/threonine-protein kinase